MNILSLNVSDLGGLSYNLCDAINRHTSHHAVNVIAGRTFTKKPFMELKPSRARVKKLLENSEVVHINETIICLKHWGITRNQCKSKKVIFHCHGSIFRRHPKRILNQLKVFRKSLKIITSTADLVERAPHAEWFPSIVPIRKYRQKYKIKRNKTPVIYYSPTGSSSKKMRKVIHQVTKQLKKVKVQVTTKTLHSINMTRKAKADIYYDEIWPSPFYGVNAIEAAAFEMPVICNMTSFAKEYLRRRNIKCPFLVVDTRDKLKNVLGKLVVDRKYRVRLGKEGLKYVVKMHSERVCVRRFLSLIE